MIETENPESAPKILIISNNALSETNNNGKTIASIFKNYPSKNIRQLYFNEEYPSGREVDSYFRILDKEMLKTHLNKKLVPGKIVTQQKRENKIDEKKLAVKKNNLTRFLREIIWKNKKWKTENLNEWLTEFQPDIVFFVAGDTSFVYDIVIKLKKEYQTNLITYITDDYILPRKTKDLWWWIRRRELLTKMNLVLSQTDLFVTISEKMRIKYLEIFGKDSVVAMNMSESLKMIESKKQSKRQLKLIYAGGLHYERDKVLENLACQIKNINEKTNFLPAKLYVFTNQKPSEEFLTNINIENASNYCGSLNSEQLKNELNSADILVHVESFNPKNIESTRLSISTKISEYLSLGKPILAIGPGEIASMEFLSQLAFCINDYSEIEEKLPKLLSSESVRQEYSKKAKKYYDSQLVNNTYTIERMIKMINKIKSK